MVYTCKFGFVLRLFFPKVSSNEVNLFFILPSFDNGFIKLCGKCELLINILYVSLLFDCLLTISFRICSNFLGSIVRTFPNHLLSGSIRAGSSGRLNLSFDGLLLYKFNNFIFDFVR